jgi:hypothetical protein
MDWNAIAIFLDMARTGSFTASAAELRGAGGPRVKPLSADGPGLQLRRQLR